MPPHANWTRGRLLGRGSTATVSLASTASSSSSSSSSSIFAVKSAELSHSYFLQREQQIHSSIPSSPYVISYFGFDITHESSSSYYNLFLEFAPGGSLSDEIKNRKLTESAIRSRARDILMGLSHLHGINLVHGDVKSQNILLADDGRAKIADFGCARFAGDESVSRAMKFMGTPMFVSPEVARGGEQGTAGDVWAVGCTVIEMATGRAPWPDASDPVSLLHRIACSEERPEAPEWLSEEGKDFLDRCLRRDAGERWSADELLAHPFVANSSSSECRWTSPKSTLDWSVWDSLSESEDEERVETSSAVEANRANPIGELLSGGSGPNWTWGDSWLTVRHGNTDSDENREVQVLVGEDQSIAVSGTDHEVRSPIGSSTSTSARDEELVISTNQDDNSDVALVVSSNYGDNP